MRLRLLQLKNWRKRQRIKQHPAVYLQRHFVILMHLIFIFLQTTEQKAPHIGLGCSLHRQWGTTERPANYTVAAQLPIAYTSTAYIILGIGIVAPDDNDAKNVSNIYNLTTKTSVSFRTENENAPSVRYIAIGR